MKVTNLDKDHLKKQKTNIKSRYKVRIEMKKKCFDLVLLIYLTTYQLAMGYLMTKFDKICVS